MRGRAGVQKIRKRVVTFRVPAKGDCRLQCPMARFGFRIPSLRKRIAARTSLRRYARNSLGLKAPRGWGWITNPRRALYNRLYYRTSRGCLVVLGFWGAIALAGMAVGAVLTR